MWVVHPMGNSPKACIFALVKFLMIKSTHTFILAEEIIIKCIDIHGLNKWGCEEKTWNFTHHFPI
jgi:hypothetical protein